MEIMHDILHFIVELAILIIEFIGTIVLISNVFRGLYKYLRKGEHVGLDLAKGLAMGLEFLLGGEILRTVVVGEISELFVVGGIIVLRVALTFIIHWEIRNESHEIEKENAHMH